ncbi:hypothetical protein DJ527_00135 [Sulfolobus sp. F1]|nr:hypothetical protein DJ527_00135 [Sulfolobus sp. F1]
MQDTLGLIALAIVVIILFSVVTGVIIFNAQNEREYLSSQNVENNQILSKAKVGYYWVVEELKNNTISFIPHVYLLDMEGVYTITNVFEYSFNGLYRMFPVKSLVIFTNGSITKQGVVLSPGQAIVIRPNITTGQIIFVTESGSTFSLVLFPPSTKTLQAGETSQNYTVFQIGNDSILTIKSSSSNLLGPKNVTSVELIYNKTPPLFNSTIPPTGTPPTRIVVNYYTVNVKYFENVTVIKAVDIRDNKVYLIYAGQASWNGTVYANYYQNGLLESQPVGSFHIYYNTTYNYYSYGPVNYPDGYVININVSESGYVPLSMTVYTYNVTNQSGYYIVGNYSELWVKPTINNVEKIHSIGNSYLYYYYYVYSINYNYSSDNFMRVGGSKIFLGWLDMNVSVFLKGSSINQLNLSSFNIEYNASEGEFTNLPIILNITYNVSSYSPPFLLNFSFTNQSLPVMFNATENFLNNSFYIYGLPIVVPTNDSVLNVNYGGYPYIVVFFIIELNGKVIGENFPS